MDIETQRSIAQEILERLEIINPYTILAGGAPRDWLRQEIANDLDFYMHSTAMTQRAFKKQIETALPNIENLHTISRRWFHSEDRKVLYKTMPDLKAVWEATYLGQRVQIIQMLSSKSLFEVVGNMDVSICQVWYKDGKIHKSRNYQLGEKLNIMFLTNEDYSWSDPHPTKMRERFPDMDCVEQYQLENILTRYVLKA